jgi:hypothetical protein
VNEKLVYLDVIIQWFKPVMISLLGSASGLIFGNASVQRNVAVKYILFALITSAPSYYISLECFKDEWIAGSICFVFSAFGFWLFRFVLAVIKMPKTELLDLIVKLFSRKK